jgi:hypothetical protein
VSEFSVGSTLPDVRDALRASGLERNRNGFAVLSLMEGCLCLTFATP